MHERRRLTSRFALLQGILDLAGIDPPAVIDTELRDLGEA